MARIGAMRDPFRAPGTGRTDTRIAVAAAHSMRVLYR